MRERERERERRGEERREREGERGFSTFSLCTDLICPLSDQRHYHSCTLLPIATTHPGSISGLVLVLARSPRLPVAGAHVTPPEGGRRLAVTVTS
jgi:hypothetical protein